MICDVDDFAREKGGERPPLRNSGLPPRPPVDASPPPAPDQVSQAVGSQALVTHLVWRSVKASDKVEGIPPIGPETIVLVCQMAAMILCGLRDMPRELEDENAERAVRVAMKIVKAASEYSEPAP